MDHHLRLLGSPCLFDRSGTPTPLRTRKQLGVLVVLLLEARGHGISRDVLVEYFWPGVSEKKGRHSLAQALTAIRGELGSDAVETEGPCIRLMADLPSDLDHPFPNGSDHPDSGHRMLPLLEMEQLGGIELSHWVDAARTRVLRTARRVLADEIDLLRSRGKHQAVQERAAHLYQIDPGNHAAVHVLAEEAAERGDRIGAVEMLEEFLVYNQQHHSHQKTGTINRLLARIKAGELETATGDSIEPVPTHRFTTVFVGRAEELQSLHDTWRSLKKTPTRTLLLTGASGVGKTSLVGKFAQFLSADGHLVLQATCQPVAREIPFATVTSLIEDMGADPELGASDPHWLSEASRIAPSLRTKFPGVPEPQPYPGETIRLTIAEAFHQLVTTVAVEKRVCIILDNIENLDPASRDVLTVLARRPRTYGAMLIGTIRSASAVETEGSEANFARDFDWTDEVDINVFEDETIHELLRTLAVKNQADETRLPFQTITSLAGGSPHYAELLLEDWTLQGDRSLASMTSAESGHTEWEPPSSAYDAFCRRHRDRSQAVNRLLEVLAVANDPTDIVALATVLGEPTSAVSKSVSVSIDSGTIVLIDGYPALRNRAHAAFVYSTLDLEKRKLLHAGLGAHYAQNVARSEAWLAKAAHHLMLAGNMREAAQAASDAARSYLRRGAPTEAECLLLKLNLSWSAPDSAPVKLIYAESLTIQGKHDEADEALAGLASQNLNSKDRLAVKRLTAVNRVRGRGFETDHRTDAVHAYEFAAHESTDPEHVLQSLLLAGELAGESCNWGQIDRIIPRANRLREEFPNVATGRVSLLMGFCHYLAGRPVEAHGHFSSAVAELGDPAQIGWLLKAMNGLADTSAITGDVNAAKQWFKSTYRRALELGDHQMACLAASNLGTTLADFGNIEMAQSWLRKASDISDRLEHNRNEVFVFTNLADLWIIRRDIEQAEACAKMAVKSARNARSPQFLGNALLSRADVEIATGQYARACKTIAEAEMVTHQAGDGQTRRALGFGSPHLNRHARFRQLMLGNVSAALASTSEDTGTTLATFVELTGFVEWAASRSGVQIDEPLSFSSLIQATGLHGVRLRLEALGMTVGKRGDR